jgi:Mg2+/Co2+ transporter CorC
MTGLITYENIIETILQREIEDEFDKENSGIGGQAS